MKGFVLCNLDKEDPEAEPMIRSALIKGMTNGSVWHIYGMYHKHLGNKPEAMKAFTRAVQLSPENIELRRDLLSLQINQRQYVAAMQTRNEILQLDQRRRGHWLGLATAYHLCDSHSSALAVLTICELAHASTLDRTLNSELAFYRVMLMDESGDLAGAFDYLVANEARFADRIAWRERKASLLVRLDRLREAEDLYRDLINFNPEQLDYHRGLFRCLGIDLDAAEELTGDARATARETAASLADAYPAALVCLLMPMRLCAADEFAGHVHAFVPKYLRKGTPSLYGMIAAQASSAAKQQRLSAICDEYLASMQACGKLQADAPERETPSTLMWLLYFVAQHQLASGLFGDALATIERAIAHSPTMIDLYAFKSRVMLALGNPRSAAYWSNFARKLDTADRYLNSECVRAMMLADLPAHATETANLFLRDPIGNSLHDNQCLWFETHAAAAYSRLGQRALALKNYKFVLDHFDTFFDDQSDFHTYCMANHLTLSAYVPMVRRAASVRKTSDFYRTAALGFVAEHVARADAQAAEAARLAAETDAERAARVKAEKDAARALERAAAAAGASASSSPAAGGSAGAPASTSTDKDPTGAKQLALPLEAVLRVADQLCDLFPADAAAHAAHAEIAVRLHKPIVALRALVRGQRMDALHPALHLATCSLLAALTAAHSPSLASIGDAERAVIVRFLAQVTGATGAAAERLPSQADALAYAERYCARATSVDGGRLSPALVAAARGTALLLGRAAAAASSSAVEALARAEVIGVPLAVATDALALLRSLDSAGATAFEKRCRTVFPHASAFGASDEWREDGWRDGLC